MKIILCFLLLFFSGCTFLEKLDQTGVEILEELVPDKVEAPEQPETFELVQAYPLIGLQGDDHLALQSPHYDAAGAAKYHKSGDAIGWLDFSFGSSLTNVDTFISKADVSLVRIHIINNTCIRNKNCERREIGYGYTLDSFQKAILNHDHSIINFLRDRVAIYKQWRNSKYPTLHIVISPILEHNLNTSAYRVLADEVKNVWPEVQLGNSPMGGLSAEAYRGAWIERHGGSISNAAEMASTDGTEITDIDSVKWIKQKGGFRVKLRWSRRNNCRTQGTFVPPTKRTSCLTSREAEQQVHVTDILPNPPQRIFTCSTKPFDSKNIGKPLAEHKTESPNDPRANLPVIISAYLQHKNADIVTNKGQKVGSLGYYGKYTDGRPRLYSGWSGGSKKTGYEFEKESNRLSGSRYIWIKQGGQCVGPLLLGRRSGDFR